MNDGRSSLFVKVISLTFSQGSFSTYSGEKKKKKKTVTFLLTLQREFVDLRKEIVKRLFGSSPVPKIDCFRLYLQQLKSIAATDKTAFVSSSAVQIYDLS